MPKKAVYVFLTAVAVIAGWAVTAAALSVPEAPSGYVNDYAQMLSAPVRAQLESELSQFEQKTSTQIFVATFPSLDGESLEDFSIRLMEKWRPGQKNKNNGALLVIFRDDRQLRIETGYGLEGALTDTLSKVIIENEIVPSFKAGRADEGVERGVRAMMRAVEGEYQAEPKKDSFDFIVKFLYIFLLIYILLPLLAYLIVLLVATATGGFPTGFLIGLAIAAVLYVIRAFLAQQAVESGTISSRRWISRGFTGGFGGGGFSSGGFGGGFGGGGGGMGGGGGASGRW